MDFELHFDDEYPTLESINQPYKMSDSEYAKFLQRKKILISETYRTDSFLSICYLELNKMIALDISINHCPNCSRYFIPQTRNNEVYCDNCKDTGYINKVRNDPYMTAQRNEYKSRNARLRKITNPAKKDAEKMLLKEWSKIALQAAKNAKQSNLDISKFKEELKKLEV